MSTTTIKLPNFNEREILNRVNNICPEFADPEINYALKCYYLKQEPKAEEIQAIIDRRNAEIEEMCRLMELDNFSQLDKKEPDPTDTKNSNLILNE